MSKFSYQWRTVVVWIFLILTLGFDFFALRNDGPHDVGYLVLGALITYVSISINEWRQAPKVRRDLASSLYIELADRVARCCFDLESPWTALLAGNVSSSWNAQRVRKFAPFDPTIYNAVAGKIAVLDQAASQPVIYFYTRLEAWRREIDNVAPASVQPSTIISNQDLNLLAFRLSQTIAPGLRALMCLGNAAGDVQKIDREAITVYDANRKGTAPNGSLRERLESLVTKYNLV